MKKILIAALIGLFVLGISGTASAIILAPGTFETPISGGLLLSSTWLTTMVAPFSIGSMNGTVTENVYTNSIGTLFTYQIARNADGAAGVISRLTASDFTDFWVNADYNKIGVANAPVTVDRKTADVVGFSFGINSIGSGASSKILWIQTDAEGYKPGYIALIDGQSQNLAMLGPAVPEPTSMLLLGMGVLGLFGLGRKKIKA